MITARLEKWVDVPSVRWALLRQLFDDSGVIIGIVDPVASTTAGLALREASRDAELTSSVQPVLIDILQRRDQLW